jgi:hypothetical protein
MSPIIFSFAFECAIRRKIQENQKVLELNGTHQLFLCSGNIRGCIKKFPD